MTDGHCFISYSHTDGLNFVIKLADELEGGHPFIPVWFERRDLVTGRDDWDDQIAKAIQTCKCLLFVMSKDSTGEDSNCKDEWKWALKYKKPVICLWIDNQAEEEFRLNSHQKIDFTQTFDVGLAKLRKAISFLDSPEGELEELKYRLADANRNLHRSEEEEKSRIQSDIDQLTAEIEWQKNVIKNPRAIEEKTIKKDGNNNFSRIFDANKKTTVFICYRRSDSEDISGRIYDRLSNTFGKEFVFKDVDSIPLGKDYREVLRESVSQCSIFLTVIGKYWLKTESGEQRLNMPGDFVRFEIETALQRRIPVIPLIVNGARLPTISDLPDNLHELTFRNGMGIRPDPDFHTDIDRLIRHIESISGVQNNYQLKEVSENRSGPQRQNKNNFAAKQKNEIPKALSEENVKHLEIIQNNITNLFNSSRQTKLVMITTVIILLLLYVTTGNDLFVLLAILPAAIFWFLDTHYLQQERKFRGLYNDVANTSPNPKEIKPFSMPINLYVEGKYSFWNVFLSTTLVYIYLPIIALLIVVYFFFTR